MSLRKFSLEKFGKKFPSFKDKTYTLDLGDLQLTPQVEDVINARLKVVFDKVFEDVYYNCKEDDKIGFFKRLMGGKRKWKRKEVTKN